MTKEDLLASPYAALGLTRGLYEQFIKPNPGMAAWGVLAGSVALYEAVCPPGQTLSEVADIALNKHRLLTTAMIGVVALHLSNLLPERYDPLHRLVNH